MRTFCRHSPTLRGFTLVELLVTLLIVAVLAGLLFPVFARARERARQTACLSNERQLGAAILLYAQDADGGMPPNVENGPAAFWPQLIRPYVHADACFVCPDADPAHDSIAQWARGRPGPSRVSYAYNMNIGGIAPVRPDLPLPAQAYAHLAPKTLSQILRPAATVLLTDAGALPWGDDPPAWPEPAPLAINLQDADLVSPGNGSAAPRARHDGRTGVLFADGHVQMLRVDEFYVRYGAHGAGEKSSGISPCLDLALGCPGS